MFKTRVLSKLNTKHFLWMITGVAIVLFVHYLTRVKIVRFYSGTILFFISCFLLYFSRIRQKKYEKSITYIVLGILLCLLIFFISELAHTFLKIPVWDFLCFYLFGKVGLSGLNFYDPHVFLQIFNNLDIQSRVNGSNYVSVIVNVGFWYPPPSMFLFLPLGIFDLRTGYIIWQSIVILFLCIDVLLLIKYYPFKINSIYNKNIVTFFSIVAVLLFPVLASSTELSQTISIFLFFLILLIKYFNNWRSGIFLAMLVIVKPLAAIFVLYFLFHRKWKILTSFFLTACVLTGLSILFFGYNTLKDFFESPPTGRMELSVFYEGVNQSLQAVLLRMQVGTLGHINFQPIKTITYILSIVIVLITIYCSKLTAARNSLLSFMIFIPAALLIYPATLYFYSVILIPVVLYFYNQKPFNKNVLNLGLLFFLYFIGNFNLFLFNLAVWIILVVWSLNFKLDPILNYFTEQFKAGSAFARGGPLGK